MARHNKRDTNPPDRPPATEEPRDGTRDGGGNTTRDDAQAELDFDAEAHTDAVRDHSARRSESMEHGRDGATGDVETNATRRQSDETGGMDRMDTNR